MLTYGSMAPENPLFMSRTLQHGLPHGAASPSLRTRKMRRKIQPWYHRSARLDWRAMVPASVIRLSSFRLSRVLNACRFCRDIRKDPQKDAPYCAHWPVIQKFWLAAVTETGKGGREKCGTKYKISLSTYCKLYRLVYWGKYQCQDEPYHAQGDCPLRFWTKQVSTNITYKVLWKLARKHSLKNESREKPCLYVKDLKEVLRTNMYTT